MLQRIIEQKDALTTALCLANQTHLCLSDSEKSLISDSITVLGPFLEATENISGDKYISTPLIIPLVNLLKKSMIRHASIPLATKLQSELSCRFAPIEGAFVTAVTTLLDPRFKKLPFTTPSASEHAVSRVTAEISQILQGTDSEGQTCDQTTTTASSSSNSTSSLWDSFDASVIESTCHRTPHSNAIVEVRRYFEEPNIDRSKNPLEWWKENETRFPNLSKIAKKYLCVPGSSVPSERLFSKAGQLVSERRNRLKSENIDKMLFLNHNL